jgi:hypothetical protein
MHDDIWYTVASHADVVTLHALQSCSRDLQALLSVPMTTRIHVEFEDAIRRLNAQFPLRVPVAVAGRMIMRHASPDALTVEVDVLHVSLPGKRVDRDMFHIGAFAEVLFEFPPLRIRHILDIQVEPIRDVTVPLGFHVAGDVTVSVQAATHSGYQILLHGIIYLTHHECMKLWGCALLQDAVIPEVATHVEWQSIAML